jgi:hypothetical protein
MLWSNEFYLLFNHYLFRENNMTHLYLIVFLQFHMEARQDII